MDYGQKIRLKIVTNKKMRGTEEKKQRILIRILNIEHFGKLSRYIFKIRM